MGRRRTLDNMHPRRERPKRKPEVPHVPDETPLPHVIPTEPDAVDKRPHAPTPDPPGHPANDPFRQPEQPKEDGPRSGWEIVDYSVEAEDSSREGE